MENHVFGWIRVLDLGFLMRSPDSESGRLFEYAFGCVQVFDAQPTPAPYTTLENDCHQYTFRLPGEMSVIWLGDLV